MSTNSHQPSVWFDPLDETMRFEDFPLYEQIRQEGGVAWSSAHGGFWAVADFSLVSQIASDDVRFRSGSGVGIPPIGTVPIFALEYDRPTHTTHRKVLTDAVGPRPTSGLEPTVRRHARQLLEERPAGVVDLGQQYAFPLALEVIFELIGAPERLKGEMEQIADALFISRRPLPDGRDPAARLLEILEELVAERSAQPGDDWLSAVVARRNHSDNPLTEQEVHGAIIALLVGGHHSTARSTASLLAQIVSDDSLQKRLRDNPDEIPSAVEEGFRMWTPLRFFGRTASEDVQLGKVTVSAGERVLLLYAGANRDPQQFETPDSFVPGQTRSNSHLAFGWGIHRCVGMPLARLEVRIAVEELLAASTWIEPEGEITWTSSTEPRHIPCVLH